MDQSVCPPRRATRFLGTSQHPLDAKGRVFFPKRFLPELQKDACGDASVVVTLGPGGCLYLMDHHDFDLARQPFSDSAFPSAAELKAQRDFYGKVEEVKLKSGRLLLPESLRQKAGIGRQLTMVGCGNRVEVWEPSRLEAVEAELDGAFETFNAGCDPALPPGGE
jgi:MraZ protein